jgi:hypothetical protein
MLPKFLTWSWVWKISMIYRPNSCLSYVYMGKELITTKTGAMIRKHVKHCDCFEFTMINMKRWRFRYIYRIIKLVFYVNFFRQNMSKKHIFSHEVTLTTFALMNINTVPPVIKCTCGGGDAYIYTSWERPIMYICSQIHKSYHYWNKRKTNHFPWKMVR